MCFSATANFVGSGVLGAVGIATFTKVKHKRELLFAALPTLFAIHQFIEGFVWLGLDGILSPVVTHNMGAAFVLYAQGLIPFVIPLSVVLFWSGVSPSTEKPDGSPFAPAMVRLLMVTLASLLVRMVKVPATRRMVSCCRAIQA